MPPNVKMRKRNVEGDSGRFLDFTWGADPAESRIFAGATAIASRRSLHPLKASNKSLAELQAKPSTQSTWWQVIIDNEQRSNATRVLYTHTSSSQATLQN